MKVVRSYRCSLNSLFVVVVGGTSNKSLVGEVIRTLFLFKSQVTKHATTTNLYNNTS